LSTKISKSEMHYEALISKLENVATAMQIYAMQLEAAAILQ